MREKPKSSEISQIHAASGLRPVPPRPAVHAVVDLGAVVANNVRAERARRNWRQEDLAERLGWSRGSIGHLESGRRRPSVADLPQFCRVFGVPMAYLLVGAEAADLEALGLGADPVGPPTPIARA